MSYFDRTDFAHRTYCDVLEEMRKILKYRPSNDKDILMSLVEELQVYGNRMEAALAYKGDLEKLHKERTKLNKEVQELKSILPEKEEENN